jgi:hypothetical protein
MSMEIGMALALGLFAGIATAAGYLGLLWLSVALAARTGRLWPLGAGFALRLGLIALAGRAMLALGADTGALLAALAGFALTRLAIVGRVRSRTRASEAG